MYSAPPNSDRSRCRGPWYVGIAACLFVLSGCGGGGNGASPPPPPNGPVVQPVVTTGDRSQLLRAGSTVRFGSGGSNAQFVISVDPTIRYQQIDGVGASLTDSSAWVIWNKLDSVQQEALMQQLFSPSAGIGISFLRQPMGASDFSASGNYSYDDMPPGQTDVNLANFSVAHDDAYIVPLLRQALAANPSVKVVSLPWSPPAWMKANGDMNGGGVDAAYFSSLAQYFVKYVQAYQQRGIPIYAVSAQNEPLYSTSNYPTANLTADEESTFIGSHLGPALSNAGLSNVAIFGYEHNWDNPGYAEAVLGSVAGTYVAGTSFHCYAGDVSAQSQVHTAYPGKGIWFTECSGVVGSNFAGDLVWNSRNLLIGATRNWARAISLWNIVLDQNSGPTNGGCQSCRGVVTVDDSTSPATVSPNVEYYVLGHVGKFVVPGAYRISSNTFGAGSIEDVCFQNPDGSIALVVLNGAGSSTTFTVRWKGQSFNYTLPAQSVATFTWK